ncbi:MAG TPA: TRC40/GET3/ArsA family transport-energizing ATPase [Candidatus Lokiarchaeia archaeon]|nr:TRC40/GET3/ArsA family transport-energizing ATPase [Candidatus Lokiarchaeia archaeon]
MLERLIVLGGKGGVGKSSISAATALRIGQFASDKKVLLISFDIAHNLGDMFLMEVGDKITQLHENVYGIEPDPDKFAEEFTKVFAEKMRQLLLNMPLVGLVPQLEEYVMSQFQPKTIPLALKNALFFQWLLDAEEFDFDYVVADFPPTGNMIALFEIPQNQVQVLLKYTLEIFAQIRKVIRPLRKTMKIFNPLSWGKPEQDALTDDILRMLKDLENRGEKVTRMMKEQGSLRLVTIAEKPSYEEIKRAAEMSAPYITLEAVHINKLVPQDALDCEFCATQWNFQQKYLKQIYDTFQQYRIWESHALRVEPIGVDGLQVLAQEIYGETPLEEILSPKK